MKEIMAQWGRGIESSGGLAFVEKATTFAKAMAVENGGRSRLNSNRRMNGASQIKLNSGKKLSAKSYTAPDGMIGGFAIFIRRNIEMEDIVIRKATMADADSIYAFVCGLEQEEFDRDTFSACYAACLRGEHNHYLVACRHGVPIGYISCHGQVLLHHAGMVYEIQELYVTDEYRSRGVGKQLLQKLEELIGAEDYKLLEVASNMKREDAHRFYLNNGFIRTTYKFNKVPMDGLHNDKHK